MKKSLQKLLRMLGKKTKPVLKLVKVLSKKLGFLRKINPKIILAMVVVLGGLYYFKSWLVVAVVNNRPITRLALIQELEKQSGQKTLDLLITKTLIFQEAGKQNLAVFPEEVSEEIKKIEESLKGQGQSLEEVIKLQGLNLDEVKEQIKLQKLLEKLVAKDLTVSDQEIKDYLEKNKDYLPKDTSQEELNKQASDQLKQQKTDEKIQVWLKEIHDKAKIIYF